MPATAVQNAPSSNIPLPNTRVTKPISWEEFQRKYLTREDEFKYEWVNGMVVKTKRSMDKTQLYLLENLLEHFDLLKAQGKVQGRLISEPDLFFLTNHRRPDIALLSKKQIFALAEPKAYEVPAFIIEVISKNDQINPLKEKMVNYRDAGVQVVWHVFPKIQQVEVYYGENLSMIKVCSGEDICSAEPVLPHFKMPVSAIFKKN